jgi:tetratricopeptide (TPR) repeat protein
MIEQRISTRPAAPGPAATPGPPSAPGPAAERVFVGADEIVTAAAALTWAARWDVARQLLETARPVEAQGPAARRLALAAAQTAVHHDFRTAGPRWAPDAISAAEAVTGPQERWRLGFLGVEHDYGRELIGEDGSPRFGPGGHDPGRLAALAQRAEALVHAAPDEASAGWAAFYHGLISDNLIGDHDHAGRCFTRALEAAEQTGDDYLAGEALRHLGDHDMEAGDLERARMRWERSAELWARIGNTTGVLAQQLLLAHLAISEGRTAAGSAIAEEVRRWSGAIGLSLCQQQADALLAGGRA